MERVPKPNASDFSLQYKRLRESYDTAFRELIRETRVAHGADSDGERMKQATLAVRRQRDKMADLLMSRTQRGSRAHSCCKRRTPANWIV